MIHNPRNLQPGDVLVHRSGSVREIARRKEDDTGWWLTDKSGLGDIAATSGDWVNVPKQGLKDLFDRYARPF